VLSLTFRSVLRTAAGLTLLACLGASDAQGRQAAPRSSDQMLRERQRMIYKRALEDELRRPRTREEQQQRLAVEQIKEDYVRIQVVSADLSKMAVDAGELDLKLVAKSAAEIRKRAERLKSNLALPAAGAGRDKEPGEGQGQLKASLTTLGELVRRFVRNPIFREMNVVDAQASARARLELEEIIELSGRLKKDCERSERDSRQAP